MDNYLFTLWRNKNENRNIAIILDKKRNNQYILFVYIEKEKTIEDIKINDKNLNKYWNRIKDITSREKRKMIIGIWNIKTNNE